MYPEYLLKSYIISLDFPINQEYTKDVINIEINKKNLLQKETINNFGTGRLAIVSHINKTIKHFLSKVPIYDFLTLS